MFAWFPLLLASSGVAPPPVVVIDPGHGGAQTGAIGVCGVVEKDTALEVSTELASILEASGRARPLLTRATDTDIGLEERGAFANHAKAALFVSIHANAGPSRDSHGIETYFLSMRGSNRRTRELVRRENRGRSRKSRTSSSDIGHILGSLRLTASHAESQRLAASLQSRLVQQTGAVDRGVMQAPFLVLLGAEMPAALVEIGFITNRTQCRQLADRGHKRLIAKSLAAGILEHLADSATPVALR